MTSCLLPADRKLIKHWFVAFKHLIDAATLQDQKTAINNQHNILKTMKIQFWILLLQTNNYFFDTLMLLFKDGWFIIWTYFLPISNQFVAVFPVEENIKYTPVTQQGFKALFVL